MRSKQYFTSIKNNPHEISTDPKTTDIGIAVIYRMYVKIFTPVQ